MAASPRVSPARPDISQHPIDIVWKADERGVPERAMVRFHRPELDRLRFAAFFLVFLHHTMPGSTGGYADAGLPQIVAQGLGAFARAGGFGVDLFFALSAYLITELLLRERAHTSRVFRGEEHIRRMLRIWPLYFLALLVLAPAMRWIVPGDAMPGGPPDGISIAQRQLGVGLLGLPGELIRPFYGRSPSRNNSICYGRG